MPEEAVEQVVDFGGAMWTVGVDDGDDVTAGVGFDGLEDDGEPLEFLHGFVGPFDQFPECDISELDAALDDCQPAVVLVHLLLNGYN